MKVFVGLLTLTALSILTASLVAYFSYHSSIESSEELKRSAKATAEAIDLLIYENIQFARSVANDNFIVNAAERAATESRALGINKPPDEGQIKILEEKYKGAKVLRKDDRVNGFLQDKKLVKPVFERMFFTDKYGLNAGMTVMTEDFVQSDERWWQEAMRSGIYVEDVGFDKPTGTFDIEICVAIPSKSGEPNGVLKVKYNLQDAHDYIGRATQYDSGYAYAISKNGQIVLHPDPSMRNLELSEAFRKQGLTDDDIHKSGLADLYATEDSGVLYYGGTNPKTQAREERIASYELSKGFVREGYQFPGFGWTFIVDNSKSEVFAPAYKMLKSILFAGLLSLCVLAVVAQIFARSLSRKIESLLRVAEEVSAGSLTARVNISTGDELESFAAGFNQMVDRLAQMVGQEKKQREALEESESKFRGLFDDAPVGYHEVDSEGRITRVNRTELAMLGYTAKEMVGKQLWEFISDEGAMSELKKKLAGKGTLEAFEVKFKRKGGEMLTVLAEDRLIRAADGKIIGIRSTIQDISARKEMEEALKESEEKYRTILENIEDGYYEVDLAGNLIFFNDPVCRMLGYTAEELLGMNQSEYIDKSLLGEVKKTFDRVYKTGESSRDFSYQVLRKDGGRRYVETSITLIADASGEATGFRGIIRDVTERRLAKEALERSMDAFLGIVSAVSEGDLTRRGEEGGDTLGSIIQSVNTMLDNFSVMVTQVKQIGLSVSSSATEILAAAEQIAAGAQRQADEITNTSCAVEEMAASMSQVSRNADASAEAARQALEMAEHGDRSVRDTSEAMERIDSAVQRTAEKMRTLGVRSSEISEIINLITDIASQTNLLALNAAIEAAHAGEAGLGFSVVAEEIRKLAERSARATRDVGSLIKSIQSETEDALIAMENGMKEVKGGSLLAEQASKALRDISQAVRQSSELIEEISAASEEQARVTENLAGAMQTISSITLETSAGSHETAQTIQGMVALSEHLNQAISQFKVKDDFIHPFSYDVPESPRQGGGNGSHFIEFSQGD